MAGCTIRIKDSLTSLAPKEQKIAKFILDFPEEAITMTIGDLAKTCSTSNASVVRFCKSVGYSGFKELCKVLSQELTEQSPIVYEEINPGDSLEAIVKNVSMSNMKAIESTYSLMDLEQFSKVVKILCSAKRIDFYGVGSSGLVAKDASNKFLRINKIALSYSDPHEQMLSAATLMPDDVAVLFSYSGETNDTIEIAELVKTTEATLITVTKYGKSSLSELADIQLFTSSSESMIRSGAMGSRIGQLTLVDMLYTAVSSLLYEDIKPYLDKTRLIAQRKHSNT